MELDQGLVGGTAIASVVGGVSSVLGGGKFANGAETGAFGYLFNDVLDLHYTKLGAAEGATVGFSTAIGCDVGSAGVCALADPVIIGGSALVGGVAGLISDTAESIYDWLGGTSDSNVPSMGVMENRRGPTLYCKNVNCGAPTGGVNYPICQNCNDRLKNGGEPIRLENGKIIREPIVPGEETDEQK